MYNNKEYNMDKEHFSSLSLDWLLWLGRNSTVTRWGRRDLLLLLSLFSVLDKHVKGVQMTYYPYPFSKVILLGKKHNVKRFQVLHSPGK